MKVLIFGATGTAGGGILRACLADPSVSEVRAIVRRPLAIANDKLRVFTHENYADYTGVEAAFDGVDACFYALGVSVSQAKDEAEYRRIIHDFAVAAARRLPAGAVLHFISGQGTRADSRMMWARVKGETERELMPIVDTVCWRPGFIDGGPSAGPKLYRTFHPLLRLLRFVRKMYVTSDDLGRAMVRAAGEGKRSGVIENAEIRDLAERGR